MIIYNLSIAFALKSLSSGLYVFYMVFLLITQAALDGIFYQVFPRLTTLNNMGATLWGSLSLLSAILFSGQYLEIRGKSRKAEIAILLMATITFCAAIGSVLFGYRAMVRVQFFLGGLFPLILLGMGIWRLRQGYRPAVYFIFGFGAILTSVSIFALTRSGLISFGNFFVYHIMQFGFGFESVILSMGLAARFKHIQKEKQDALDTTIRQQRVMNQVIARFVPENFLRILGKPNIPDVALGDYVEKELTIVFLDIRSFTTISEALTPKQSFEYINGFLKIAGPVVSRNAGFIDKYTGDGILALFESPFNAMQASLQLQLAADKCHDSAMATFGQPLRIGIGIHYGKVMLGTIGEPMRMDGTVISDAVNIASRIENLTKQFNIGIIATQAVLEAIESRHTQKFWMANHLGSVALKGKTTELEIYGISPDRELESPWPRASGA